MRKLGVMFVLLYMSACAVLYARQESMLFLSHYAPNMTASWKPRLSYAYDEMRLRSPSRELYGVLWHAPKARGTILYCHGNADNIESVQMVVPQFIEHGYNILIWDYRGYGLSTGQLTDQQELLADAESVYAWLSHRRDAGEIVFYGRSLGSGVAVYLAHKFPGHKALLEAAYDSLASVAQDHYPIFPASWILKYPMPSSEWVRTVRDKIFIIHGTEDHVIPLDHPKALAAAAPQASLTMLKGVDHNGLSFSPQYTDWLNRAL